MTCRLQSHQPLPLINYVQSIRYTPPKKLIPIEHDPGIKSWLASGFRPSPVYGEAALRK